MLGRNTYAAALVVMKPERLVISIVAPVRLRYCEKLFWILGPDEWIFRLRVESDGAGELAVIDPPSKHKFILIFDVRTNEVEEHPTLDAIAWIRRIIGGPVGKTATHQPVRVVAAAGTSLAGYRLPSWIDPACMRADGTVDALEIS